MFSLQYNEGWVYYEQGSYGIMGSGNVKKVRIDGNDAAFFLKNVCPVGIYFINSTFYYASGWMGNAPLSRVDAAGQTTILEEQ